MCLDVSLGGRRRRMSKVRGILFKIADSEEALASECRSWFIITENGMETIAEKSECDFPKLEFTYFICSNLNLSNDDAG